MNTDIICRWRDAITDPPPDGYYLLSGNTRDSLYCVYMGGQWIEDGSSMLVDIQPGDQWLDVTTIHAVAVSRVQAAVDEMTKYADEIPGTLCARGLKWARQLITKHTEVTHDR